MAGRPKLKEDQIREVMTFRILSSKKDKLQEKADIYTGGNLSAYIERVLFSDNKNTLDLPHSESKLDRETLYSIIRELNKMGSNLNQLTKKAHQGHFIEGEILTQLKKINQVNSDIFSLLIEILEFRNA